MPISAPVIDVVNATRLIMSFFSFFQGWFFQPGEVSIDEFVRGFWLARGVPEVLVRSLEFTCSLTPLPGRSSLSGRCRWLPCLSFLRINVRGRRADPGGGTHA